MTGTEYIEKTDRENGRKPGNRVFELRVRLDTGMSLKSIRAVITSYQRQVRMMAERGEEFKVAGLGTFAYKDTPRGTLRLKFTPAGDLGSQL